MTERFSYLTVGSDVECEIEVKRSRFLCTIARVEQEDQARALVDRLRKRHWDARHHCSAFILGPDGRVQRSNDDGEPAGTAGAPMLEVMRGADLSDVVAVVTRWFGGTLLGAGGLVRAYSDAVRAGLVSAGVQQRSLVQETSVIVDPASAGRVEGELRARGFQVLDVVWAAQVSILLGVAPSAQDQVTAVVSELTAGAVTPQIVSRRWVDLA